MKRRLAAVLLMIFLLGADCGGPDMGMPGDDPMMPTSEMPDPDPGSEDPPAPVNWACCLIDGSCRNTDSTSCTAIGGTFSEGESCVSISCQKPDQDDLRALAQELESIVRDNLEDYINVVSIVGREYWNLNGDVPGYTVELMGKEGAEPDATGHFTTSPFVSRYKAVLHAALLISATENSDGLTEQERNGLIGYAKTMQAYSLLLVLNHQFSNGILPVTSLDDPDPAKFLDYTQSLQHIAGLFEEGAAALANGGAAFVFSLSHGFSTFSTPATFRQFNRALFARVRIYQGDKAGALTGIANSFFNINGDVNRGPTHVYGFERPNPLFNQPDEDLVTVHPDWIADAEGGDLRVNQKTRTYLAGPVNFDGLTGDRQVNLIHLYTDSFPIIRNEELILIYAEAQIGSDVNEVLAGINRVRNAAGLGNYLGATDDASLLNEVLNQRRFSLFGEGHRWIDLRRTGKFGQINVDRPGDVVHMEFPRPDQATLDSVAQP